MAQELTLLSPEKTVLTFNLARLGSRVTAQIIDVGIIVLLIFIITFVSLVAFREFGTLISMFASTTGVFLYFILLEGLWNGQTIGKKAVGIRVRMADGTPITFPAALGRNLLRPADFLPVGYFAGAVAMFTNPRSQRFGDMFANTIVVHERRAEPRFTPAPYVLGVHPFESQVGELRGMGVDDYAVLKRFCDRFPELPPYVQERLVQEVWEPFAQRFKIKAIPNVHAIYLAEAAVMKYGRARGLMCGNGWGLSVESSGARKRLNNFATKP